MNTHQRKAVWIDEGVHHLLKTAARLNGKPIQEYLEKELADLFKQERFTSARFIRDQEVANAKLYLDVDAGDALKDQNFWQKV